MSTRRGTKFDPFVIGEEIYIVPLERTGRVTNVVYPGNSRAWIKYEVEYIANELFGIGNLKSLEDAHDDE